MMYKKFKYFNSYPNFSPHMLLLSTALLRGFHVFMLFWKTNIFLTDKWMKLTLLARV